MTDAFSYYDYVVGKRSEQVLAVHRRGPDRDGIPRISLLTRPVFGVSKRERKANARLIEPYPTGGKNSCYDTVY